MIARCVHHISFAVTDLDRSLGFYRDLLGCEPIPRPDLGFPGAWLRAGESEVHLLVKPEGFEAGTNPGRLNPLANHHAFGIEDYEKVLGVLRERGVEVLQTSAERGQMWILDPDGNVIELIAQVSGG